MQFNSITFLLFLAVVLGLHYSLRSWTVRKANLLLASYIFYAAWNPLFIPLIIISTISDWLIAGKLGATQNTKLRRLLLVGSLTINLGLLSYCKYTNFLLDTFNKLIQPLGINYVAPEFDIILPIGISFYTFQTLSYTIDVYRKRLKPEYSLLDFSLFVTFFPQLVAGPIVRASFFLPQCAQLTAFQWHNLNWGFLFLIIGLFQKIVLADSILAPVVDQVYGDPILTGSLEIWTAILAFSGQIFFDFSGYSSCAIGVALCLGFVIPLNFRSPYGAIGFSDFWRRWHISLSSWFRDYLYISLGGNRKSAARTRVNLFITMLIAGLWHGASLMFLFWGALHGIYLILERALHKTVLAQTNTIVRFAYWLMTFTIVSLTWILFRSPDMLTAITMFASLTKPVQVQVLHLADILSALIVVCCLLGYHWFTRQTTAYELLSKMRWWFRPLIIAVMLLAILFQSGGDERAFIYFQF